MLVLGPEESAVLLAKTVVDAGDFGEVLWLHLPWPGNLPATRHAHQIGKASDENGFLASFLTGLAGRGRHRVRYCARLCQALFCLCRLKTVSNAVPKATTT